MRVGIGYDSHRFDPARPLVLGGVTIPDHPGLSGHSDGDAVLHAVIDALLGAAGLGGIGDLFPDDDPRYAGADSLELLEAAVGEVHGAGYVVGNVDVTVIAETPRLAPYVQEMSNCTAPRCGVRATDVSVKGKSNEAMGWIGRGEGLAAIAVVALAHRGAAPASGPAAGSLSPS